MGTTIGAVPMPYQNPSGFNAAGGGLSPMPSNTPGGGSGANNPWAANSMGGFNIPTPTFNTGGQGALGLGLDSSTLGGLTNTFGEGEGNALYNFLAHGAGYNPQVANALIAEMQPNIERGMANIAEQMGSQGGYGSPMGIAEGDFMSQAALGENQILADLYNQAVNRYYGVLGSAMGPSSNTAQTGPLSAITSALGIGSNIYGMLSQSGLLGSLFGGGSGGAGLGSLGSLGSTASSSGILDVLTSMLPGL